MRAHGNVTRSTRPGRHTTTLAGLNEQDGKQEVSRNVSWRRRGTPWRSDRSVRPGRQDDSGESGQDGGRDAGREDLTRRTGVTAWGVRAAIIRGGLTDLRLRAIVNAFVTRTGPALAALPPRLGRSLPAGALAQPALCQREHGEQRHRTSQREPHAPRMRWKMTGVKWPRRRWPSRA